MVRVSLPVIILFLGSIAVFVIPIPFDVLPHLNGLPFFRLFDEPGVLLIRVAALTMLFWGIFLALYLQTKDTLFTLMDAIKSGAREMGFLDEKTKRTLDKRNRLFLHEYREFFNLALKIIRRHREEYKQSCNDRDFSEKHRVLMDTVIKLNNSINTIENRQKLLDTIIETAVETIVNTKSASLMVLKDDGYLEYEALAGLDRNLTKKMRLKLESIFLYKLTNGAMDRTVIVRNKEALDRQTQSEELFNQFDAAGAYETRSALSSPIYIDRELHGVFTIDGAGGYVFDENDRKLVTYFAGQIGIAIKNHSLFEKALYLARYDRATESHNRLFFEEMVDSRIKEARRYRFKLQLVIFDLNSFKEINDTYGHNTGDAIIKHFAQTVKESIRESDLFGRYGGDEFLASFQTEKKELLVPRVEAIQRSLENNPFPLPGTAGEKNRDAANPAVGNTGPGTDTDKTGTYSEGPVSVEGEGCGKGYVVTFSYGIATFPEDAHTYNELLQIADGRMYAHKKSMKA